MSLPKSAPSFQCERLRTLLCCLGAAGLLAACGSGPQPEKSADIETQFAASEQKRIQKGVRNKEIGFLLQEFDNSLQAFRTCLSRSENEMFLRKARAMRIRLEQQAAIHEERLLLLLQDSEPRARWIAAAALGFSGNPNIVGAVEKALADHSPRVRESAAFGLGMLRLSYTPLERLNKLVLDENEDDHVKHSAAWALFHLQVAKAPAQNFALLWPRVLEGEPYRKNVMVVVQALRGLGLLRKPETLAACSPYLSHPQAFVRQAALIAAGRSGNKDAIPLILPFLTPEETVPNVRLTARKALKELAGNKADHETDIEAWRKEFGLVEETGKKG